MPTEKYDTKRSYKHAVCYFQGIASISNFPVYIENRNGSSNVKNKQDETLKRAFEILTEKGIKITHNPDYQLFCKITEIPSVFCGAKQNAVGQLQEYSSKTRVENTKTQPLTLKNSGKKQAFFTM